MTAQPYSAEAGAAYLLGAGLRMTCLSLTGELVKECHTHPSEHHQALCSIGGI